MGTGSGLSDPYMGSTGISVADVQCALVRRRNEREACLNCLAVRTDHVHAHASALIVAEVDGVCAGLGANDQKPVTRYADADIHATGTWVTDI